MTCRFLQQVIAATYDIESSSLDTEGISEDVDVFVDHMLFLEQLWIFVVDVPENGGQLWHKAVERHRSSHLFEMTSSLHNAS